MTGLKIREELHKAVRAYETNNIRLLVVQAQQAVGFCRGVACALPNQSDESNYIPLDQCSKELDQTLSFVAKQLEEIKERVQILKTVEDYIDENPLEGEYVPSSNL